MSRGTRHRRRGAINHGRINATVSISAGMPKFGLFTTDADLQVRTWDAFLAQVTGIPAASALGRPVHVVLPEAERGGLIPMLHRVLHQGTVEVLAPALHPAFLPAAPGDGADPERVHQRVVIGPVREDGRITGVAVTVEDVTSRVGRESDLTSAFASDDWKTRQAAVRELSAHGPEIVDSVVRTLREQHHNFNVLSSILDLLISSAIDVIQPLVACLGDDDVDLRIQAAWILGERRDVRAIPALIAALDDADANVRFHAIEALGALRATRAVDRLLVIAEERDFFLSFPAVQALRRVGDASVAPRLVALLDDPLLRAIVSEALGELGDELAVPALVQLLNQPAAPADVVADALSGLWERYEERYGGGEHIASLTRRTIAAPGIQNLLDALDRVGADRLRGPARVLGWLEGAAVERALTRLLGQPSVRAQVVEALVRYGASVVMLLMEQLCAEDLETRQAAVLALGRIGDTRATPALVAALEDPELALPVAGALARLGDRGAFEPLLGLVGHRDVAVRQSAIGALNSIGHPDMAQRIAPLLDDPSPLVRESAVKIAGYFGYRDCVDSILARCTDPIEAVRRAAIDHLPFFDDPRVLSALSDTLDRDTPPVRAAAAAALARVDKEPAIALLRRAVTDPDPWVRYFALRAIGTVGDPGLAPAVEASIANDPAEQVRVAAIDVLGRLDGPDAVTTLGSLTASARPDVARAAIRALAHTTSPSARTKLEELTRSSDDWRRTEAVTALGAVGGAAAIDALQWAAAAEADLEETETAIRALGAIASRESEDTEGAVRAIVALTAEPAIRDKAVTTLARLARRARYIADGLTHASPEVRRAVVEALSRMKDPEATRYVERALDDGVAAVRATAVSELRRLGSRQAVPKLLALARTDPDADVRRAAMLAVTRQRPEMATGAAEGRSS